MAILGTLLMVLGGAVMMVGGLWLLVVAFQESVLWGLGSIFVPFVSLIFVIMHWDVAGKPFLIGIAGWVPMMLGAVLAGAGAAG